MAVADLEVSRFETIPMESVVGVSHGPHFRLTFVKFDHAVVVELEVHLCQVVYAYQPKYSLV